MVSGGCQVMMMESSSLSLTASARGGVGSSVDIEIDYISSYDFHLHNSASPNNQTPKGKKWVATLISQRGCVHNFLFHY